MTEQLMAEQQTNPEVLKENPVIVVDIDGVLFDTPGHAVERWNAAHGTEYKVEDIFDASAKHNKELFRHWHEDGMETDEKTGEKFDDGFYGAQKDVANCLLIPGAREVLSRLKHEYGASLHALTARNKANLEDVTLTALGQHFGVGQGSDDLIDELHFSGDPDFIGEANADKGTILRDILGAHIMVEDSIANANSAKKAGIASFVLDQSYNLPHRRSADPEKNEIWEHDTAPDWDTLYHYISDSLEAQGFKKVIQ